MSHLSKTDVLVLDKSENRFCPMSGQQSPRTMTATQGSFPRHTHYVCSKRELADSRRFVSNCIRSSRVPNQRLKLHLLFSLLATRNTISNASGLSCSLWCRVTARNLCNAPTRNQRVLRKRCTYAFRQLRRISRADNLLQLLTKNVMHVLTVNLSRQH
jgi:hypothetical protein